MSTPDHQDAVPYGRRRTDNLERRESDHRAPRPVLRKSKLSHPRWHVLDISYTSTGGFRIGGWMLLPRKGQVRRGLVVGHGYGGRGEPDFDVPVEETAVLFLCFRGLSLSACPPISSDPALHVLYNIERKDDYIIGGCVDDRQHRVHRK